MVTDELVAPELEQLLYERVSSGEPVTGVGVVPGEMLVRVVTSAEDGQRPRGLRVHGAHVSGRISFEGLTLLCPVALCHCEFDEPVNLREAEAASVRLSGSVFPSLDAAQLKTRGDLVLDGVRTGSVDLEGAHVGGILTLTAAHVAAFDSDRLVVDQEARWDRLVVDDRVSLVGGRIGGQLSLQAANVGGRLAADGLDVEQDMYCDAEDLDGALGPPRPFTVAGFFGLPGAHIGGSLHLQGARLRSGLWASGLRVDGDVNGQSGTSCRFVAEGPVTLRETQVGGSVLFADAVLQEVELARAQVGRDVSFGGAVLRNELIHGLLALKSDLAMIVDLRRARVDCNLVLRFAEPPNGGLNLTGARVGHIYDDDTTWCPRLRLQGCIYDSIEAVQDGERHHRTRLRDWWDRLRPRVAEDVERRLRWIQIAEDDNLTAPAMSLRERGKWRLRRMRWWLTRTSAADRLREAEADQGVSHEQLVKAARLVSTVRKAAAEGARTATVRAPDEVPRGGYAPQPYTQLMACYRHDGRDADARVVGYRREQRRRRNLNLPGKIWNVFMQWTVGYGYKPLRIGFVLAALVAIGSMAFSQFHSDGRLSAVGTEPPPFNATLYTVDRLVPVVSLGFRDDFALSGGAQWWAFAFAVIGWALTVAAAAGVGAVVRRE